MPTGTRILADEDITDRGIIIKTIEHDGEVAGHVLSYLMEGRREVSYWIGRDYWGQGIATQALEAYLELVKDRPIYGRAAKDNAASLRVMIKCGFVILWEDKGFANARGEEIAEYVLCLYDQPPKTGETKIGLDLGTVRLSPYSADWPRLFEEEKVLLQAAVGPYVLDIQHVGSTSIPGIPAKPIIDIGIAVENFEEAAVCIAPIEALGYTYKGENGIPRRHYFSKGIPRTHHIHINEINSPAWENHILFRDYLIQHPEVGQEYSDRKLKLAGLHPVYRAAYQAGKDPFIEDVLRAAREALKRYDA